MLLQVRSNTTDLYLKTSSRNLLLVYFGNREIFSVRMASLCRSALLRRWRVNFEVSLFVGWVSITDKGSLEGVSVTKDFCSVLSIVSAGDSRRNLILNFLPCRFLVRRPSRIQFAMQSML
jgi:hypothetical protein